MQAELLRAVGHDEQREWRLRKGAALRRAREARGLSQTDLADKIGVNISTISEIERGVTAPKLSTIEAAADVLEMSIDALVGRAEYQFSMLPAPSGNEKESRSTKDPWPAMVLMQQQIDDLRLALSQFQPHREETPPTRQTKGRRTA